MRIVLTSVHCWPDVRRGGERYVHELAGALHRAGHEVSILSTGTPPGRGTELDVPIHRLPVRHLRGARELAVEMAFGGQAFAHVGPRALAGRIDVWHATSTSDAAAAAVLGRTGRFRTVFTDHGFPARRSRENRPDARLFSLVARHIDEFVCVSEAAAGYLSTDYRRAARVVPPGVHWAKHSAGTRAPRPTLLYAGSLSESRKGVGLLLAAAELLRQEIPDLQVWLLGPGTPSEGTASDLVTRCELVEDATLREAYARAWVTVLPSVAESFGMTVVESLASGTPVVVRADSGGPAEIVDSPRIGRRAGTTAADLAAACREALDLALQPDTVQACRDSARRYDWDEAIVPALLKIYQS